MPKRRWRISPISTNTAKYCADREHYLEVFRRALEGLGEAFARLAIQMRDRFGQVIERALQVGAIGAEDTGALLKFLDFAVGGEVHLADSFHLGAQLDDSRVVLYRDSAVERGNYLGRHRVELGAEFFDEGARQFFAESAGAFALEGAFVRIGFQSSQALLCTLVVGAAGFELVLGRVAFGAQARQFGFEFGLAGARG